MAEAIQAAFGGKIIAITQKLIELIKAGTITVLTDEAAIVATLQEFGVPITPGEAAMVDILAKVLLSILVPKPVVKLAAAPMSRVALLTRVALLHHDAFGGAHDTPILNNLRAMRTYHSVHQLVADAGGTDAVSAITSTATPAELAQAETAARVTAHTTGMAALPTTINWTNILTIVTQIMAAIAALKV